MTLKNTSKVCKKILLPEASSILDAAKNLAFTAADSVGTIASKFAQKGLKEGTEFVDKGLDKALGLDPNKTLKDQAADVALKIKEKGQFVLRKEGKKK